MISTIKIGNSFNNLKTMEFYIESASEVASLPTNCAVGSKATDISTGTVYVLWSTKEWKPLPTPTVHVDIPTAEGEEF